MIKILNLITQLIYFQRKYPSNETNSQTLRPVVYENTRDRSPTYASQGALSGVANDNSYEDVSSKQV